MKRFNLEWNRLFAFVVFSIFWSLFGFQVFGKCKKEKVVEFDVNIKRSGEKINGPVTIRLTNINPLRFHNSVSVSTTYLAAQDYKLPFIPTVSASPESMGGIDCVKQYREIKNDVDDLVEKSDGFISSGRKRELLEEITKLSKQIDEFLSNCKDKPETNEDSTHYNQGRKKLRSWNSVFKDIISRGEDAFILEISINDHGFTIGTGKETKVELIKQDRFAEPGAEIIREEIVTVVFSSIFSVSAGFGFSTLDEQEFSIVRSRTSPTDPTLVNKFGFQNRSKFRPMPVILLNTRLFEMSKGFDFHFSTGAGVDIKTGQPAGSDVEFVVGPSISFRRSLFLTPALHVGRVPTLAGGFKVGDLVPAEVTAPPIEKSWKTGFIFTITYKFK
jgi:hypothetical protein